MGLRSVGYALERPLVRIGVRPRQDMERRFAGGLPQNAEKPRPRSHANYRGRGLLTAK